MNEMTGMALDAAVDLQGTGLVLTNVQGETTTSKKIASQSMMHRWKVQKREDMKRRALSSVPAVCCKTGMSNLESALPAAASLAETHLLCQLTRHLGVKKILS